VAALNPNFIDHRYAKALIFASEPAKAIEVLAANMRLDPLQSPFYATGWLGIANYMLKRYGKAVRLLRESTSRLPNLLWPHMWLASAYAQSGQLRRPEPRSRRCCESTPVSRLKA
jgi:hypothetical protein